MKPAIRSLFTVGLSLALIGTAVASGSERGRFVLTERVTSFTPLDLGAPGPSPGDQFTGTGDLFDARGNKVGTSAFTCIVAGAGVSQCSQVYELSGGKLVTAGTTRPDFTTSPLFDEQLAVTGGTGIYRGSSGEVRLVQHNFTEATLTINLSRR
jgi:hypothetical protein